MLVDSPSLLTCIPGAPGSTPESRIAITTPRPSYSGYLVRNWVTPVSFLGSRPQTGKLQSMMSAMFRVPLPLWLQENHPRCFLCTVVALYINRRTGSAPACAPVGCASFEVRLTADGTTVSDDYAALILYVQNGYFIDKNIIRRYHIYCCETAFFSLYRFYLYERLKIIIMGM